MSNVLPTPWDEIVAFVGVAKMRVANALVWMAGASFTFGLLAPFVANSDQAKALSLVLGIGSGALLTGMSLGLLVVHVFLLNTRKRAGGEAPIILSKNRMPEKHGATRGVVLVNSLFLIASFAMIGCGALATVWAFSKL